MIIKNAGFVNKEKWRYMKKIISLLLIIFLVLSGTVFSGSSSRAAETSGRVRPGVSMLRVRETPGGNVMTDSYGNTIYVDGGTPVTILDTTNSSWYKVTFSYGGSQLTGYMSSSYLEITGNNSGQSQDVSSDDFEAYLSAQNFPESYKPYLRELHAMHPAWVFKSVQTGIDWGTLMENEKSKPGQVKNMVLGTSYAPHYNWRSTTVGYDAATNTWYPFDGDSWFAVSDDLLAYYMDPRTYLYQNYIFCFEALSYQDGMQNQNGVESILRGTFMENTTPPGESRTYSDILMEAGRTYGVSPYHLAARIKQEQGSDMGICASGQSQTYPGIFNHFNIGAYDSSNPALLGLKYAATAGSYGRPWNSAYKSLMGGTEYLSSSFISEGQDTLYTQKFNVTNNDCLFWHQYMSNVQAPAYEGNSQYQAYADNGLLDSTIVFKIPVYLNMPEEAVDKPADSGNPNATLKSLAVSGYSLTPSFHNATKNYSLIVPQGTDSISISAEAASGSASVSGAGKVSLKVGTNTVKVTVTAQNGGAETYVLTVVREGESSGTPANKEKVHRGDMDGNGKINAVDIVKIQRLIVGIDSMTDEAKKLGDVNGDGSVTAIDVVMVQRHIVGIEEITW